LHIIKNIFFFSFYFEYRNLVLCWTTKLMYHWVTCSLGSGNRLCIDLTSYNCNIIIHYLHYICGTNSVLWAEGSFPREFRQARQQHVYLKVTLFPIKLISNYIVKFFLFIGSGLLWHYSHLQTVAETED